MLRLYDTNLTGQGLAPKSVELSAFQRNLPIYVGRGALDKPVDIQVALKREGREVMSRRHCKLEYSVPKDTWVVEDLGALNGVYVNYERIKGQVPLKDGDILQLGGVAENVPKLSELCIRFKFEDLEGKESGKRKRGVSQNGADSLKSLKTSTVTKVTTHNVQGSDSKGRSPDDRWKENKSSRSVSSEDNELETFRKEQKRLKKELKESNKRMEDLNEEIASLKSKCTVLRKDNKNLRDEKVRREKDDKEKQERLEEVEEELKITSDNLDMTQKELEDVESRLKFLQPTGKSCVDDSALRSLVECPLCSLPLLDAVVTACSHGFCRLCLETKVNDDVMKGIACVCPVCKTNPMGSRTHMYYFRSKHLDDVVSLLIESSETAKQEFTKRLQSAKEEMGKLELNADDRYGFIGVKMGAGSSIERLTSRPAEVAESVSGEMRDGEVRDGESSTHLDQKPESGKNEGGLEHEKESSESLEAIKPPPKCSYCGVDDHEEKACPEQEQD